MPKGGGISAFKRREKTRRKRASQESEHVLVSAKVLEMTSDKSWRVNTSAPSRESAWIGGRVDC